MDSLLLAGLNNAVWAAALALMVAVIAWFGHRRPALIHALWLLVLVKLLTPSFVRIDPRPWATVPQIVERPSIPMVQSAVPKPTADAIATRSPHMPAAPVLQKPIRTAKTHQWSWPWRWQETIGMGWLVGSTLWCSAVGIGILRFRRLLRSAQPAPDSLRAQIDRMAAKLDLRRVPMCFVVSARVPPMLWALVGPPRLILPGELWDRLTDDERDAILAHELAHLKRRDEWARRLEAVALGLYWWNPVAWWARREVERTEEQCCDAWVLWALPGAAPAYARALVMTADFLSQSKSRHSWPAGASGAGHLPPLKRRLTMILEYSTTGTNQSPRTASRIVVALAGVSLLLLPAWALSEPPKTEPTKPASVVAEHVKTLAKIMEVAPKPAAKPPVLDAPPDVANKVKFAQVVSTEASDSQSYAGRIETDQAASIYCTASGTLKPECQSGKLVEKGDVLFKLDSQPAQDVLDRSRQKLDSLRARLESLSNKLAKHVASGSGGSFENSEIVEEINETRTALKTARADVEQAEAENIVAAAPIVAPIKGMVNRHQLPNGLSCEKGQILATITPVDSMLIQFRIDETTFLKLRRQKIATGKKSALDLGSPVEVTLTADPSLKFQGQIQSLDTRIDSGSGTLSCRASVPNPDGILIPGLSASVNFAITAPTKSLLLPLTAPLSSGGNTSVLIVNDQDVVEVREVRLTATHENGHAIKDGLKEGDWVVISGQKLVKPGMKVKR